MTDKVLVSAQATAPPGVHVVAITNHDGPVSIQGEADGEAALPGLLALIASEEHADTDVYVVACFDDTGIADLQKSSNKMVIGIGQAAFYTSALRGKSFSVVTTLSVAIPIIEENIDRYGLSSFCKRVRASEVPVLDLEKPGSDAQEKVSQEVQRALDEDQCECIVLGCAGMTDLAERLQQQYGVPVIDGVTAATGLAYGIAGAQ